MSLLLCLMDIGWGEWVLIAIVILFAVGPKRLPEMSRKLGRSLKHLERGFKDVKDQLTEAHPKSDTANQNSQKTPT